MTEIGSLTDWTDNDGGGTGTSFTLTSGFNITGSIDRITLGATDTFDGDGYVLTLDGLTSFEGLFNLKGGTIKDLGIIVEDSCSLAEYQGWLVRNNDDDEGFGTIQDCYVQCASDISNRGSNSLRRGTGPTLFTNRSNSF